MADIAQLPVMTASDAEANGFARFNDVPTLPIDIPDGNFTITARTSEGRRITFFFGDYRRGAPPGFVDIEYHDNVTTIANSNSGLSPTLRDVVAVVERDNVAQHRPGERTVGKEAAAHDGIAAITSLADDPPLEALRIVA